MSYNAQKIDAFKWNSENREPITGIQKKRKREEKHTKRWNKQEKEKGRKKGSTENEPRMGALYIE